jgi:putative ABC transport system permease protein
MKRFVRRWISLFRAAREEDDLGREMDAHLALAEDEFRRRGMSADDARRTARRVMGSVSLAKDLHRDARSFVWVEDLRRDCRHAVVALRRSPGFALSVVVTLALGVGATTAIFSVVYAVLLRPLPYPDADRLVYLFEESPPANNLVRPDRRPALSVAELDAFRSNTRTLSRVGVQVASTATIAYADQAVRLSGSRISPAFLSMLGALPQLGRLFDARDEATGGVILLSHAAWQRVFSGATDVIGRPLELDGRRVSIVGVLPSDFYFHPNPRAEYWTPFVLPTSEFLMTPVLAQLRPGISSDAALADITTTLQQIRGSSDRGRFAIVRAQDQLVAAIKPALLILAVSVVFVLLISCVNVANLVLARALGREREIAIRRALGAGAGRMVRLFLTESLVLAFAGGAAGTGLAFGAIDLLRLLGTSAPQPDAASRVVIPRLNEVAIDGSTLLFALAISVATGVLFGVAPALRRSRSAGFYDAGGFSARVGADRFRHLLVVAEVASAMVLLVGGMLMMTSFIKLANVDGGFDPHGVVTFQATLPQGRDMAGFAEGLVDRLRAIDGVRAAGYSTDGVMTQARGHFPLRSTPQREPAAPGEPTADPVYVSRDYLKAMGMAVVAGRGFDDSDRAGAQQVMLVNQTLARSGMVRANPVGARVYALFRRPWEIVGIVKDTRLDALDREPHPQFYIDLRQLPGFPFEEFRPHFAVRTAGDVTSPVANLRDVVRQIEPRASVDNVTTVDEIVWNSISRPRLYTVFITLFAGVALVMAATGIFRTDGVCRSTAHAGNRGPHGAGGAASRRALRDPRSEFRAGSDWRDGRPGRRGRADAVPRGPALRRDAAASGDVRRRLDAVRHRRACCRVRAGVARDARRSGGGVEGGVVRSVRLQPDRVT